MLAASKRAWGWAQAHPREVYRQPSDIHTGEYGDPQLDDEFAWAGAELFVTTGEKRYRPDLQRLAITLPAWGDVKGLAWVTLSQHRRKLSHNDNVVVKARVMAFANELVTTWRASAYGVGMRAQDYDWGSNSGVLNRALMLIQAYRLQPQRDTLAAQLAQAEEELLALYEAA